MTNDEQKKQEHTRLMHAIGRKLAYKNINFILAHQNDTLSELTAYLKACTADLGHVPAKSEVIGGDLLEYRFGTWEKALRSFYSGSIASAKTPPKFENRKIVREILSKMEPTEAKENEPTAPDKSDGGSA